MPHHIGKITPQEALQRTIEHREIFHDEMLHLMRQIMSGEVSPLMIAAITTGLASRKKRLARSLRRHKSCVSFPPRWM